MKVLSSLLLTAIVFSSSVGSTLVLASEPGGEVEAPCSQDGADSAGKFLRKCSDVLSGMPGEKGYSGPKGVLPLLDDQVKKSIETYYKGKALNRASENSSEFEDSGKPVCNLVANSFNKGRAEEDKNHLGEVCGTPSYFTVNVSRGGVNSTMHLNKDLGTMEFSYLWGARVQAMNCHWQSVRREILQNRKLKVSAYCSAPLEDYRKVASTANKVADDLIKEMGSKANAAEIWKCDPKTYGGGGQPPPDGSPLQRAFKVCNARASIEKAFMDLAMCEIEERTKYAHRTFAYDADAFIDGIRDTAVKTCNKRCTSQCSGCKKPGSCSKCGTQCANDCYTPELRRSLAERTQKLWPNNGSCTL